LSFFYRPSEVEKKTALVYNAVPMHSFQHTLTLPKVSSLASKTAIRVVGVTLLECH
jgi:hypothetical protein